MSTLRLPVRLTDEDRLHIQGDLSLALSGLEAAESAKKASNAEHNARIKSLKLTIHDHNSGLVAGVIYREVEVRDEKDFATGKTRTIRLDTGEEVISKDIDPDERQTVLGLPAPGSKLVDVGGDASDEQRDASTPEEAEAMRAERLANERAERISAAVSEARARIVVLPIEVHEGEPAQFQGTVQAGNRVIEETGFSEAQTVAAVVASLTEWAEAEEAARPEPTPTWEEVQAASAETQRLAEIDRLAAEQKEDQKKNGPKNLLKAPKPRKGKKIVVKTVAPDGTETEVDVEKLELAGEGEATPLNEDVPPPADDAGMPF